MIESFAFTQINIGSGINRNMLKPQFAAESKNWRIDRAEFDQSDATAKIGWMISNQVPGFKQLAAIRRSLPGHPSMSQIVYSDGLAAISVFIEPLLESSLSPGPTSHGAINVYVQPEADRMVTVMGEAPPQTIKLMAESIAPEEK
jgi:sigma-E factor negative regulatory protein RseB